MKIKSMSARAISVFLVCTIIFTILACAPFTVSAAQTDCFTVGTLSNDSFIYNVVDEDNEFNFIEVTGYKGNSASVTVPETINGKTVVGIASNAFERNDVIESITLPDTVFYINDYAFYNCSELASIKISKNILLVGNGAFNGTRYYSDKNNWENGLLYIGTCLYDAKRDVKDVKIKDGTTVIGNYAFTNSQPTSVTLPFTLSSIGDYAFAFCRNLSGNMEFPDLCYIGESAFASTSITGVTLPDSLISIGPKAFAQTDIETVKLPTGLEYISDGLFEDTDSLKSIDIPETVRQIGSYAFSNSGIKSIKIPQQVKYIGQHAFGNANIETVDLPDKFAYIDSFAFEDSSFSKNAKNWVDGVLYADGYVLDAENRTNIKIKNGTKFISPYACKENDSLKSVTIPSSVTAVGDMAFFDCTSLKNITIPSSVNYIGFAAFGVATYYGEYYWLDGFSITGTKGSVAENYTKNTPIFFVDINNPVAVKPEKITLGAGESYSLSAYCGTSKTTNGSWSSSNKGVATVSSSGRVTAKSAGTAKITFRYKDGKKGYCTVTVKPAPKSVKINPVSVILGEEEKYTISESTNSGSYANASNLKWSSSNTGVAIVRKSSGNKAVIIAQNIGTSYITIKLYNGKTATCKVTVKDYPTKVDVNPTKMTLGVGEKYTISESTPSGTYANPANIEWLSSDTKVATVKKAGGNKATVTALDEGDARIDVNLYNDYFGFCDIIVKPAPKSVSLSETNLALGKGETFIIAQNSNKGSYAKTFTWSSSNTKVATVAKTSGNKAKITAKNNGTAYITIKTYNGKTATCKVTVKSSPSSVSVNPKSVTLGVGEKYTISESTNSGSYANAANLKWSSSNTAVAVVTKGDKNKAQITAKGVGTANITIRLYNGKTATCRVTVKSAPKSVAVNPASLTLEVGEEYTISERTNSGSYANAANLNWSSSNPAVAAVTKGDKCKAVITANDVGTADITIKLYNGKTSTCKVTVNKSDTAE